MPSLSCPRAMERERKPSIPRAGILLTRRCALFAHHALEYHVFLSSTFMPYSQLAPDPPLPADTLLNVPHETVLSFNRPLPRSHCTCKQQFCETDPPLYVPRTRNSHTPPQLIADHAMIVSGMMPGGMAVIGIYAFCPSDQANAKSSLVHSILRKIYKKHASSSPLGLDDSEDERLFLLVPSHPYSLPRSPVLMLLSPPHSSLIHPTHTHPHPHPPTPANDVHPPISTHSGIIIILLCHAPSKRNSAHEDADFLCFAWGDSQLCSKTKRNTCKAFNCKDTTKGSHPAELKLTPNVASMLVKVSASYRFSVSCDDEEGGAPAGVTALGVGLESELESVGRCVAVMGGACAGAEAVCGSLEPGKGGKAGKGGKGAAPAGEGEERRMELYSHEGPVSRGGSVRVEGCVSAVAYVGGGESTLAAAAAVKRDVASSISARLGFLMDEWAASKEDNPAFTPPIFAGLGGAWGLPRRAYFPLAGSVVGSTLIPPDGNAAEALDDVRSLLRGIDVPGLDEAEAPASAKQPHQGEAQAKARAPAAAISPAKKTAQPEAGAKAGARAGGPSGGARAGGDAAWKMYAWAAAALGLAYAAECAFDLLPFI